MATKPLVIINGIHGSLGNSIADYLSGVGGFYIAGSDRVCPPRGATDGWVYFESLDAGLSINSFLESVFSAAGDCGDVHLINAIGRIESRLSPSLKTWDGQSRNSYVDHLESCVKDNLITPLASSVEFANFLLSRRKHGSIVNFSSVASSGNSGQVGYSSAKAGLESATVALCKEFAGLGIRFNCVAPGFIEANSTRLSLEMNKLEEYSSRTAVKRLGNTSEVAQCVHSILTNGFINGATIRIDGGLWL